MYTLPGIEKLSIDQPDVHCKNSFTGQRGNELYKKIVQNSDWRYREKKKLGRNANKLTLIFVQRLLQL